MRWQKRLRFVIALFVVVFAALVVVSLRKGRTNAAPPVAVNKVDDKAISQGGAGNVTTVEQGKTTFSLKFGNQLTYADGRSKLGGGVTVVLPDKNGRSITINSQEAEVSKPPDKAEVGNATFTGDVTLTTSDGITVSSATAAYSDAEQMATIPGPVTFKKGRMTGSGVGATYDQSRNVLWLLDKAKVDVAPDKQGSGAVHVVARTAGMARGEHYMKFQGDARLEGQGNIATGDDVTAYLTEDDERMTRMELRGRSRIAAQPGASGPQDMRANDIDLAYAEDGRTLQSARLVENASVQLPAQPGKAGRRVAGRNIDIALGPDGSTVTNLAATENVQVDLPAEGETPARRIKSQSLLATGAPDAGIQAATFAGDVEFKESRAAKGKVTAIDRTAKSARMDVKTKPGFGDIEQANFHTNVHFTDGTQTTAYAPTAVYQIAQDRLDLSPDPGDTGRGPHVSDGRISVEARTIQMTLGSQVLKADTNVRSVMLAQPKGKDGAVKVPSMMKQDKPVNVKSNRLNYDGSKSIAIYEGNSRLWQEGEGDEGAVIQADKIVLEDKTGNLRATTKVSTSMLLTQGSAPKSAARPDPTLTTADELFYEDGKHRATYTGNAHMSGPDGDVTADKIDLFLAEQGGELERAEADGNVVSRQEQRRAYGTHLTYLAKEGEYTMVGAPVKVYKDTAPDCSLTEGAVAKFSSAAKTADGKTRTSTSTVSGSDAFPHKSGKAACGSGPGSH